MRITGGVLRSRALLAPRGDATRPTSDRVREALFAILGGPGGLQGMRVLDLYAGTGALAFEALSRGALTATLVESGHAALQVLHANAKALGVDRKVHVVRGAVEKAPPMLRADAPFDLVFVDPPYALTASGAASRALEALFRSVPDLLAEGASLVLEHAKNDAAPPLAGLTLTGTRRYGDTSLSFYTANTAENGASRDPSSPAEASQPASASGSDEEPAKHD